MNYTLVYIFFAVTLKMDLDTRLMESHCTAVFSLRKYMFYRGTLSSPNGVDTNPVDPRLWTHFNTSSESLSLRIFHDKKQKTISPAIIFGVGHTKSTGKEARTKWRMVSCTYFISTKIHLFVNIWLFIGSCRYSFLTFKIRLDSS